jgi:hypothetical protein
MITTTGALPPSLGVPPRSTTMPMGLTGSPTATPASSLSGLGGGSSPAALMVPGGQLSANPSALSLSPESQLVGLEGGNTLMLPGGSGTDTTLPASILGRMGSQPSPLSGSGAPSSSGSTDGAKTAAIDLMMQALMLLRQDAVKKEEQNNAVTQQIMSAIANRAMGGSPTPGTSFAGSPSRNPDPSMMMAGLPGGRPSASGSLPSSLMSPGGARPSGTSAMPPVGSLPMGLTGGGRNTPIV